MKRYCFKCSSPFCPSEEDHGEFVRYKDHLEGLSALYSYLIEDFRTQYGKRTYVPPPFPTFLDKSTDRNTEYINGQARKIAEIEKRLDMHCRLIEQLSDLLEGVKINYGQ